MRSNYFAKLTKYMKNVYNIGSGIKKLSDGRKNPKYNTALEIIQPLLLDAICDIAKRTLFTEV